MLQSSSALKQQLRRLLGLKAWGTCSSRRLLLRPKRRRRLRLASLASAISNSFPTVEMSESIFCAFHSSRFLYFCTHTEANNHWSHSHCWIQKSSFGCKLLKKSPFCLQTRKKQQKPERRIFSRRRTRCFREMQSKTFFPCLCVLPMPQLVTFFNSIAHLLQIQSRMFITRAAPKSEENCP